MTVTVADRLALARVRTPDAVDLARMISLAVRAEPALLRAARLAEGLDAAAEADLWFSGLVSNVGPLGVWLRPAVADLLRENLGDDDRERAWDLVLRHHGQEPWSIRLEELINYCSAGGAVDVDVEELVAAALVELRAKQESDEREALGIARWLLTALARLPQAARDSPAAAVAAVAAGAHLDGQVDGLEDLSADDRDAWLPWVLHGIGTADLRVKLLPGDVSTSALPGSVREVSTVVLGADDGAAVYVPATDPLVLDLRWVAPDGPRETEVRLRAGEQQAVEIEARMVTLRAITGDEAIVEIAGVGRLNGSTAQIPACAVAPTLIATAAERLRSVLPYLTFEPESGTPIGCREPPRVAGGVVYIDLESPAPSVVPLARAEVGVRWRLADGRPGGGTIAAVDGAEILLAVDEPLEPEPGAAVALERPWGAVIGVLLDDAPSSSMMRAAAIDLEAERSPFAAAPEAAEPVVDEEVFALPLVDGRLPRLADVDPQQLGVRLDGPLGVHYVPRDIDPELDEAIQRGGLVMVTGPPGAGQRRTLWEAARRTHRDAGLAVPSPVPAALSRIFDQAAVLRATRPVALWLDPAQAFLDPLETDDARMLTPWLTDRPGTCVLAILEEGGSEFGEDIMRRLPEGADASMHVIERGLSEAELDEARRLAPDLELDPADPWAGTEIDARERAVSRLRKLDDEVGLSEALRGYGRALNLLGRRDEARAVWAESIELWRAHVDRVQSPEARSALADRLEETASVRPVNGDIEGGVATMMEAVQLRRELAREDPEYPIRLARSLTQLAGSLAQADRLDDAVPAAEEGVALYRELVAREPPGGRAGRELESALEGLSQLLAQARRLREAVTAAEEAVELHRRRLESAPDVDRVALAYSLLNLAGRQGDAGDWHLAVETAERAVAELREHGEAAPLARSLGDYGRMLAEADRRPEAIAAVEEATVLLRQLLPADESWHRRELGHLLLQLSQLQAAESRDQAALDTAQAALDLWRALAEEDPDGKYWLSAALEIAAAAYDRVGRLTEAIALEEEHLGLLDPSDAERREFVQQTLDERRARAGPAAGSEAVPSSQPEVAEKPLGEWTAARIAAGISLTGGTLMLYADRLALRPVDTPVLEEQTVEISLEEIKEIEVLSRASLLRPPSARLHLTGGRRMDVGILASRLSPNFRRANNRAFDDWLQSMPARIPRRDKHDESKPGGSSSPEAPGERPERA